MRPGIYRNLKMQPSVIKKKFKKILTQEGQNIREIEFIQSPLTPSNSKEVSQLANEQGGSKLQVPLSFKFQNFLYSFENLKHNLSIP